MVDARVVLVIPARYGSSRFPGKPLVDIFGKPMIQQVYERAVQVQSADLVIVATDDLRIKAVVEEFGGTAFLSSVYHASGTDRMAELMEHETADLYVNVQGDEPLVRPNDIDRLIKNLLADKDADVATMFHKIEHNEALSPHAVKVVLDNKNKALYFSRSVIPYQKKESPDLYYYKHVGVYAFRRAALAKYVELPSSTLEQTEQLEQLRLLEAGMSILSVEVQPTGPGVDTEKCLEKVKQLMEIEGRVTDEPH